MGINIRIKAGGKSESSVEISGSARHVITVDEVHKVFGIGDAEMKRAVKKYFGKKPDDAFVHGPTPWNDLFKTNDWEEVSVVLVPIKSKILSVSSQQTTLATEQFVNEAEEPETVSAAITKRVETTLSTTWRQFVTGGEKIKYSVEFLGSGDRGHQSVSYCRTSGKDVSDSRKTTVGSETPLSVQLEPGERAKGKLTATKGKMKVQITYKAFLTGNLAVNYNKGHKGQNFWALDVEAVTSAAGINNKLISTEIVEIEYFSNASVELDGSPDTKMPVEAVSGGAILSTQPSKARRRRP